MSGQRTMKRAMRRAQGLPEKNAISPMGTTGKKKGPARSPTQREVFAEKRTRMLAAEGQPSTLAASEAA